MFQKGHKLSVGKGAPKGNKNASKGARLYKLIDECFTEEKERKLLLKIIEAAMNMDWKAIDFLYDRRDGKPKQITETVEIKSFAEPTQEEIDAIPPSNSIPELPENKKAE